MAIPGNKSFIDTYCIYGQKARREMVVTANKKQQ